MSTKKSSKKKLLSTEQIDDLVVAESEEEAAWELPIKVRRTKAGQFSLSPELAARAAFLARVHHVAGVNEWLLRVIKERIEMEEVAYAAVKREMRLQGESRRDASETTA